MNTIRLLITRGVRSRWPLYLACMQAVNLGGGILVAVFILYVLPFPRQDTLLTASSVTIGVMVAYLVFACVASFVAAALMLVPVAQWYLRGGPPTRREQLFAMRAPLRQSLLNLALWVVGGILFVLLTYADHRDTALAVLVTVVLAAVGTFGAGYMLGERILRPVAARALTEGEFAADLAPGVSVRVMLTWGLGTLTPCIGIGALCSAQLNSTLVMSTTAFAVSVLALAGATVATAFLLSLLTSSQISDPIRELRRAVDRAGRREPGAAVEVYDGSEVGVLQAGFNRMVRDAEERDRLRQLFGRHVGEDVARRALEVGTPLGGETRFVAVLFVDVIGSTALASRLPPIEVVDLLNRFFRIVVDAVAEGGGFVNKFVGDEVLAVFGAPLYRADAPTAALATARRLHEALRALPEISAGVGVSAGTVVAGNVGTSERLEYTVIGDPVNEAARLTELAKLREGRVLASRVAVEFAEPDEQDRWEYGEHVQLRGRGTATRVAWPRMPGSVPACR